VRAVKPPSTPAVETVVVDVIEEPVPGVTVVTEFEATEVRDESGATPAPPESEELIRTALPRACPPRRGRVSFLPLHRIADLDDQPLPRGQTA